MPRHFCILPLGFSEECAADCEHRHRHCNVKEVRKLEGAGEIQFFDLHPITNVARYVVRNHSTQQVHIPKRVIETAAGAYRRDHGEVRHARRKVKEYGQENRELRRLNSQSRDIALWRVKWNKDGLLVNFISDGGFGAREFDKTKGRLVYVTLKPRTPEALAVASRFWKFIAPKPSNSTESFQVGSIDPFFLRSDGKLLTRASAKLRMREYRMAMEDLDKSWPTIVESFDAGPYSEAMTGTKPTELPSGILRYILEAYIYGGDYPGTPN